MVRNRISLLALATFAAACDAEHSPRDVDSRIAAGAQALELGIVAYDVEAMQEGEVLLLAVDGVVGQAQLEGSGVLLSTDRDWTPADYRVLTDDIRETVLGEAPYAAPPEPSDTLAAPRSIDAPTACSDAGGGWTYCANGEGWCLSQGPSAGSCFYCGEWGSDEIEEGHACD